MSEIEVGEYVRTDKGIDKIKNINFSDDFPYSFNEYELKNYRYLIYDEDIIKHSHNIIDLIEVGDYVNGSMVYEILEDGRIHTTAGYLLSNEDIKSILTKEQFAQNCYEVKE